MVNDDGWMRQAACGSDEIDPELFFLKKQDQSANMQKIRRAKALCHGCPVRQDCLKYSLAHNIKHGIWGGMTVHERRRYFPRKVRAVVAEWWFRTHPGSYAAPPMREYTARTRRSPLSDEDIAS